MRVLLVDRLQCSAQYFISMLINLIKHEVGQSQSQSQCQCQPGHNFIIVGSEGADGAVLTGLHYKNTRLYANDIKVMVGIHFFLFHKETSICDSHFSSISENVEQYKCEMI